MFIQTNNKYLKRAIAWELLLWYANYNTPNAAEMALYHLPFALKGVTDQDEIRHKVIVGDRKSTRLNSSHVAISYAVFCLKKKNEINSNTASNYKRDKD